MTKELTAIKKGGSFLVEDSAAEDVFTPEDFSDEQRMIGDMTEQFVEDEDAAHVAVERVLGGEPDAGQDLLAVTSRGPGAATGHHHDPTAGNDFQLAVGITTMSG